ncbi:uncharacterized protein [Venturia canescens]|uniref:uncharacterized protein n=1 Tax=Venturia canescens TaxID=32260 RepID=UPI001C9D155D|nr:uncharacterized protein LOC122417862 [Venturia canescens]
MQVKETETMMKRVMGLLGRLVFDEVRRKTCSPLAPDLRKFLLWTLGGTRDSQLQGPPEPGVADNRTGQKATGQPDEFLFPNSSSNGQLDASASQSLNELARKVNLLKGLITEYNALSQAEKTKIHSVHDYLLHELALLMKLIESKEKSESRAVGWIGTTQGLEHRVTPGTGSPDETGRNSTNGSALENAGTRRSRQQALTTLLADPNDNFVASQRSSFPRKERWKRRSVGRSKKELKSGRRWRGDSYEKMLGEILSLRREKRADYLGFEAPRIFVAVPGASASPFPSSAWTGSPGPGGASSFDLSVPIRGKNRLEDEVLLLNKREAWKKENRLLLEEVAFGRDSRSDVGEHGAGGALAETRRKRAFGGGTERSGVNSPQSGGDSTPVFGNDSSPVMGSLLERSINVFPLEEASRAQESRAA